MIIMGEESVPFVNFQITSQLFADGVVLLTSSSRVESECDEQSDCGHTIQINGVLKRHLKQQRNWYSGKS